MKLVRQWWHDPAGGSLAPADQVIDPGLASVSPGVREMACRLNNDGVSFDRAADNLARTAQIKLSGERVRQLVIAEGRAVLAAQEANAIPVSFQPQDCRPLPPLKRGSDLSFKEFKVVVFYDESGRHWHERLSRGKRRSVGALVRHEAHRLNFRHADERIANVDGASWIRQQLQEQPLRLNGLGLDFYHLGENVHRCQRAVYRDKAPDGEAWVAAILHSFKHDGFEPTWQKLVEWRASLRSSRKRKAADRLLNYVSERRDMINYPEFQSRGWQIGSGPTESRCKTSTARLKGRGRRWNASNAEAVAALTTLHDSHQWHLYWKTSDTSAT